MYKARDETPTQNRATLKVTGCSRPRLVLFQVFPRMKAPQLLWALPQYLTSPKYFTGISPVANCVHYTGSAQVIAQVTRYFWAFTAAEQLFKTQVKDPGMILELHHPRTQKRSCSAKYHGAKSCKERTTFLQAVKSAAAMIQWLLVAGRTKTNTTFLRVMEKN